MKAPLTDKLLKNNAQLSSECPDGKNISKIPNISPDVTQGFPNFSKVPWLWKFGDRHNDEHYGDG